MLEGTGILGYGGAEMVGEEVKCFKYTNFTLKKIMDGVMWWSVKVKALVDCNYQHRKQTLFFIYHRN